MADIDVKPDERPDAIDREKFVEMIASKPFRTFLARIGVERDRAVNECRTREEIGEIRYAQGKSWVADWVLALPVIILDEMKAKEAAPKKR